MIDLDTVDKSLGIIVTGGVSLTAFLGFFVRATHYTKDQVDKKMNEQVSNVIEKRRIEIDAQVKEVEGEIKDLYADIGRRRSELDNKLKDYVTTDSYNLSKKVDEIRHNSIVNVVAEMKEEFGMLNKSFSDMNHTVIELITEIRLSRNAV